MGSIDDAEEGGDDVVGGRMAVLKEEVVVAEARVAKGARVILRLVEAEHVRHADVLERLCEESCGESQLRGRGVGGALGGSPLRGSCVRGASLQRERHCVGASPRRGRGVTAAWNWRSALVDALGFVLVKVLCLVDGVTVGSFEDRFQLLNPPGAKRKF